MKWDRYKREIQLILKQNNVEHELYSLIAEIFRSKNSFSDKSLRDVSHNRRTKNGKEKFFWGIKGFPDFVVLDTQYPHKRGSKSQVGPLGAIEVKYVNYPLFAKIEDRRQLIGHILWFGKVIYTNGIDWYFYECNWKIDNQQNDEFHNDSYLISGTKQEIDNAWGLINKYIDGFSISTLSTVEFHLGKIDDFDGIKWNYSDWEKLIRFLDEELLW